MTVENPLGGWRKAFLVFLFVFGLSFVYAFVRYTIVRDIPLGLFIINKAIALSATVLIGFSFILGPLARFWPRTFVPKLYLRKYLGLVGFGGAAFHVLVSFVLLGPIDYFSKPSFLFGILAFLIFSAVAATSFPLFEKRMKPEHWKFVQRLGYLAYFFVLLHVALMGSRGWLDPASYQYGLASITLIASLFIIFVFLLRILVMVLPKKQT